MECFLTLPQIFSWKLRIGDSDFGNCRYYIAWKESVHDHTFSNPKIQGESLSVPGSWHQPVCPLPRSPPEVAALPAAPVPYPPWDTGAAEMVPSALHIRLQRHSRSSQRIAALFCSKFQTEYCRVWGFFSPFRLNYSVVEMSKIKDF